MLIRGRMKIKNSCSSSELSKFIYAGTPLGATYGEGVPDHLPVHKLITDVPFDQPTGWYKLHSEQPICKRPVPTERKVISKRRGVQQGT